MRQQAAQKKLGQHLNRGHVGPLAEDQLSRIPGLLPHGHRGAVAEDEPCAAWDDATSGLPASSSTEEAGALGQATPKFHLHPDPRSPLQPAHSLAEPGPAPGPCPQAWRPDRDAASAEEPSLHPAPGNRHVRLQPCLLSAGFLKRNRVSRPQRALALGEAQPPPPGPTRSARPHPRAAAAQRTKAPRPWSSRCGLSKPRGGSLLTTPFGASEAKKGVEQNLFSKQEELCRERERELSREGPQPLSPAKRSPDACRGLPHPHTRTGAAWRGVWTSAGCACAPKRLRWDGQQGVSPARGPCLVLF
ncbi:F-BAR domain only protein 1-like [Balaenoptera musculus]|uniref:F-BAR domain only protein 1-like n=1 Tax=Balaenoptera musculus TaxID=9771 RepID=A0A8B8VE48_BALMU|nr:F-BAR domain only protein 1-like [Balaenoptera musculus]